MNPTLVRWMVRLLGFAVAIGVEFLLVQILTEISDRQIIPKGLGWFVMPFLVGICVAGEATKLKDHPIFRTRQMRICLASCLSWYLIVLAYVFVVEPFGGYIAHDEWFSVMKWIFIPPVIAGIIFIIYRRALRNDIAAS